MLKHFCFLLLLVLYNSFLLQRNQPFSEVFQYYYSMVCCFSNHTSQTSLLPEASLGAVNATKAAAAQKTATAATILRSVKERYGPCTLNDL
jgi:hypothetical protein